MYYLLITDRSCKKNVIVNVFVHDFNKLGYIDVVMQHQ
jgi:hypothetical protein